MEYQIQVQEKVTTTTETTRKTVAQVEFDEMKVSLAHYCELLTEGIEQGKSVRELSGVKVGYSRLVSDEDIVLLLNDRVVATVKAEE